MYEPKLDQVLSHDPVVSKTSKGDENGFRSFVRLCVDATARSGTRHTAHGLALAHCSTNNYSSRPETQSESIPS